MSTRLQRVADKSLNEKHAKILASCLSKPENKYCADCKRRDAQALTDLWEPILVVANLSNKQPSESNIDSWIRSKYELKRWAMKGPIPDPDTLGDGFSNKP
ncbi:7404_t:CDS:2, partial [Racocetra persica]